MPSIREWQTRLFAKHNELGTWDRVGDQIGITGAMANRIANEGYDPRDLKIRAKLDLPSTFEVQGVIGITDVANAQVGINARTCIKKTCDRRFISNAPNRRKCFDCSPYRGKGK